MSFLNMEEYEDKILEDGFYEVDLGSVEHLIIHTRFNEIYHPDDKKSFADFTAKYPNFVIASAYETGATILLSQRPKKITKLSIGSGFNYGSTNLLINCPPGLLILAEND